MSRRRIELALAIGFAALAVVAALRQDWWHTIFAASIAGYSWYESTKEHG